MSLNLGCDGAYMVAIQIGTYDSLMIFSNNDGGSPGVFYRLEQYYRRERQNSLNNLSRKGLSDSEEYRFEKEWWDSIIATMQKHKEKAERLPGLYDFYVM